MMTKQQVSGGSGSLKPKPTQRVTQPPTAESAVEKAKVDGMDGRAESTEPPDPHILLEALRGGWRASLPFPASAPSKNLRPLNQQDSEATSRAPSILLGTDDFNAVLTSKVLKPHLHLHQAKDHPNTIPGLKYNPRDDDAQSHRSSVSNKSQRQLVHVPSQLVREGMAMNPSRATTPDDEFFESGMSDGMERKASARALLLGNSQMKSKLMNSSALKDKSSAAVGVVKKKEGHINFASTKLSEARVEESSGLDREQSSSSLAAILGHQRYRGQQHGDHSGFEAARKMQPLMMKSFVSRISSGNATPRRHFASQDNSKS